MSNTRRLIKYESVRRKHYMESEVSDEEFDVSFTPEEKAMIESLRWDESKESQSHPNIDQAARQKAKEEDLAAFIARHEELCKIRENERKKAAQPDRLIKIRTKEEIVELEATTMIPPETKEKRMVPTKTPQATKPTTLFIDKNKDFLEHKVEAKTNIMSKPAEKKMLPVKTFKALPTVDFIARNKELLKRKAEIKIKEKEEIAKIRKTTPLETARETLAKTRVGVIKNRTWKN